MQKIEEYISDPVVCNFQYFSIFYNTPFDFIFLFKKYRCNAEPANSQELESVRPNDSVFDKLLEGETNNEENNRDETIAAAVAAAVAPKSVKKKAVRLFLYSLIFLI